MKDIIGVMLLTALAMWLYTNNVKRGEIQKAYDAGYQNAQMDCRISK